MKQIKILSLEEVNLFENNTFDRIAETANELNKKLEVYIQIKAKMDSDMAKITKQLESDTVVNNSNTKNGDKEELLV